MSYPRLFATPGVADFAELVDEERQAQLRKWGDQRHLNGTGRPGDRHLADYFRAVCKANGPLEDNWRDIAAEEAFELFAETGAEKMETELIQLAAVLAAWWYDIQRTKAERASDAHSCAAPYPDER
jgi:hypothetical protein